MSYEENENNSGQWDTKKFAFEFVQKQLKTSAVWQKTV